MAHILAFALVVLAVTSCCASLAFQHHNHSTQHRHSTDLSFIAYALDTAEGAPLGFSAYICFIANCRFRFGGSQPRNRSPTSFPPSTTNYSTQRSLLIAFQLVAYRSVTARLALFELRLSPSKFVISSFRHFSRCIFACCCNLGEVLLGYSAPQCAPHPPSASHRTSCIHTSPSPSHFSSEYFT